MLFEFCFFKNWILFTHKIINFKGVREITSLSCYLFFVIWCFTYENACLYEQTQIYI